MLFAFAEGAYQLRKVLSYLSGYTMCEARALYKKVPILSVSLQSRLKWVIY